jgi:hypothetical protein
MGHIKEPVGVDLNVGPMPFSEEDRQEISAIIANYKSTGEIPTPIKKSKVKSKKTIAITDRITSRAKPKSEKKKQFL